MNILDSHVHFWKYDAKNPEFAWIGEGMETIKRSFMPEDWWEQVRNSEFVVRSEKNNSSNYSDKASDYEPRTTNSQPQTTNSQLRTPNYELPTINYQLPTTNHKLPTTNYQLIAVQAAETWQETEFLLNLASKHNFIKGVVGWADIDNYELRTPNYQLPTTNSQLPTPNYELLKGFRHIIQAKPHGFMTDDKFRYFISKLKNQNYTYDLLLKPHQLEEALDLVQEFPNQKFVIDHLAKPDLRTHDLEHWKEHIQAFKHLPNVSCKLSGMVTEAYWKSWKNHDFKKVLDIVFNTFGTDRLMFGSDWPVCLVAGSYQDVLGVVQQYVDELSIAEQEKLFYQNGAKFYNIIY